MPRQLGLPSIGVRRSSSPSSHRVRHGSESTERLEGSDLVLQDGFLASLFFEEGGRSLRVGDDDGKVVGSEEGDGGEVLGEGEAVVGFGWDVVDVGVGRRVEREVLELLRRR